MRAFTFVSVFVLGLAVAVSAEAQVKKTPPAAPGSGQPVITDPKVSSGVPFVYAMFSGTNLYTADAYAQIEAWDIWPYFYWGSLHTWESNFISSPLHYLGYSYDYDPKNYQHVIKWLHFANVDGKIHPVKLGPNSRVVTGGVVVKYNTKLPAQATLCPGNFDLGLEVFDYYGGSGSSIIVGHGFEFYNSLYYGGNE